MTIIAQAFSYYDKQITKYQKYYDSSYNFVPLMPEHGELHLPKFKLTLNDKDIIEGDYNVIGAFLPESNTWIWAWSTYWIGKETQAQKHYTYLSKQIVNYAFDIVDKIKLNIPLYTQLRVDLLSSKFTIEHPIHLEKILSIALYITHSDMIYKRTDIFTNATIYYVFKNVKPIN